MSSSPISDSPDAADSLGSRLRADATATATRLAELEAELDQLIHDPDVILEDRDAMRAMVESARHRADSARQALERYEAGNYGRCQRCGGEIGAERLEALPDASTCINCR
jgi:RNA polymerase-binding transcription factor DksA